jgi:SET domain-containing protein
MKKEWNHTNFVHHLTGQVYCRLGVSKIHGVGVMAIRDIPYGIFPISEIGELMFSSIKSSDIKDHPDIHPGVKKLVADMCPENQGTYEFPVSGLNAIGVSWYINHSETPNMGEHAGYFFTLRDIKEGEELTVDYRTYGELNL